MSVESLLYARLAATAGVTALFGAAPRIYPAKVPQGAALPHGRFVRVATERPKTFTASPGLSSAEFQVDIWATTSAGAKAGADAVRQALSFIFSFSFQRLRKSGDEGRGQRALGEEIA